MRENCVASDDPINLCSFQLPKEGLGRKVLLFVKGLNLVQLVVF